MNRASPRTPRRLAGTLGSHTTRPWLGLALAAAIAFAVLGFGRWLAWRASSETLLVLCLVIATNSWLSAGFSLLRSRIVGEGEERRQWLILLLFGAVAAAFALGLGSRLAAQASLWAALLMAQAGIAFLALVPASFGDFRPQGAEVLLAAFALGAAAIPGVSSLAARAALVAALLWAATVVLSLIDEAHPARPWPAAGSLLLAAGLAVLASASDLPGLAAGPGLVLLAAGATTPLIAAASDAAILLGAQIEFSNERALYGRRTELLLNTLPGSLITVDRDLRLRFANERARLELGLLEGGEGDEQVGWADVFSERERQLLVEAVVATLELHEARSLVLSQRKGRLVRWFDVEVHPVHDPVLCEELAEIVATEITDLVDARRAAEKGQGHLDLLTFAARTIAGESEVEVILASLLEVFRGSYPVVGLALYRRDAGDGSLRLKVLASASGVRHALGAQVQLESEHPANQASLAGFSQIAASALGDDPFSTSIPRLSELELTFLPLRAAGKEVGVLGLASTAPIFRAAESRDMIAQIGILVGGAVHLSELVRELAAQRAVALEASRLKSAFLANTSHELRTPLTSILGFLRLILDGSVEEPERRQEFLGLAHDSAIKLLAIINDVLDLAKIEAGKLDVTPLSFELGSVVLPLADIFIHQAKEKSIRLEIADMPAPIEVYADPDRIRQVLMNLLSNAVKFTPRGGEIRLETALVDAFAVITVADSGIGIPADQLDKVFRSFYQVDGSSTRDFEGSGLGLAICRRLTELQGGSIELCSEGHNRGTTALLRLPRKAPIEVPSATLTR